MALNFYNIYKYKGKQKKEKQRLFTNYNEKVKCEYIIGILAKKNKKLIVQSSIFNGDLKLIRQE